MFLTEEETIDIIMKSDNKVGYEIKKKMSDKDWCVAENNSMPKTLLNCLYLVANKLNEKDLKMKLFNEYNKNKERIVLERDLPTHWLQKTSFI